MQKLDPSGEYTNNEVKAALSGNGGARNWSFRYERLRYDNSYVEDIDFVQSCTISNNFFADIKRTAKLSILDTGNINYLSDRIKPYVRLNMPKDGTNRKGYVEWPQGVFLLSSPSRALNNGSTVVREVEAYDQLLALKESSFDYRYSISKGSNCVVALQDLIATASRRNLAYNPRMKPRPIEGDPEDTGGYRITTSNWGGLGLGPSIIASYDDNEVTKVVAPAEGTGWHDYLKLQVNTSMVKGKIMNYSFKVRSNNELTVSSGVEFSIEGNKAEGPEFLELSPPVAFTETPTMRSVELKGSMFIPDSTINKIYITLHIDFGLINRVQTLYIDGLVVEANREVGNYFDGSTTDTSGVVYSWMGTKNNSVSIATSKEYDITPSTQTFTEAMEWEPGTSKLQVINDILAYINYESAWYDENGVFIGRPYISPTLRGSEFTYATDDESVILDDTISQELDLFSIPNKWILVVSQPESAPLVASYTNSNPLSPTSTVARGREIVDYRNEQEASDLTTLRAKAQRLAFEASQVYEKVSFSTGLMPIHSNNDIYTLTVDGLAINTKYSESSWDMPMDAGAAMTHEIRKITDL